MAPISYSAVVITKNEARNIRRCILSLQQVADEILIVDSFSTDQTPEICAEMGARFIQTEWLGYGPMKNYANSLASYDWILSLDADEELDARLIQELLNVKKGPDCDAYKIKRRVNYCGTWVRFTSWNPDKKIRLFNRHKAEWSDKPVHEFLILSQANRRVRLLKGYCFHYTVATIAQHLDTINRYSELKAQELFAAGKRRVTLYHLLIKPSAEFIISYFIKLGFLDGWMGFHISTLNAADKYLRYAKLRMLVRRARNLT